MYYVLLLFIAISSAYFVKSEPDEYTQFGCKYKNSKFALNTTWRGFWPNDPIYSDPITDRLFFNNSLDYEKFYEKVKSITLEVKKNILYDDVSPFITMLEQLLEFSNCWTPYRSFEQFFKQFVPTYPPPAGDDDIYALIRVYEKLVKEYPNVANNFIIGTKDSDLNERSLDALIKRAKDDKPSQNFQHKGIVGIIPLLLLDQKIITGSILLEMAPLSIPMTILPQHEFRRCHIYEEFIDHKKITYQKYNDHHIVIESYNRHEVIDINGNFVKYKDSLYKSELVYASRSLCSFIQSSEKGRYLNPVRTITKYKPSGQEEKAAVLADILENKVTMRYSNNGQVITKTFNITDFYGQTFTEDQENFINEVQSRLEIKEKEEALKDKLKRLNEAINKQNAKFKESFKKLQERVIGHSYTARSVFTYIAKQMYRIKENLLSRNMTQ